MRKPYGLDDSDDHNESNRNKGKIDHLQNYKGICDEEEESKYFDPLTGAHFDFDDFCNRLANFQKLPEEMMRLRSTNSNYYSSDSNTKTTASCLISGSAIITTPTHRSHESLDQSEVAIVKADNSTFKLKTLKNLDTVNSKIGYEEGSSRRLGDMKVPRLVFNQTHGPQTSRGNQVKRVNRVLDKVIQIL